MQSTFVFNLLSLIAECALPVTLLTEFVTKPDMEEPTYLHSRFGGDTCWYPETDNDTLTVIREDILFRINA